MAVITARISVPCRFRSLAAIETHENRFFLRSIWCKQCTYKNTYTDAYAVEDSAQKDDRGARIQFLGASKNVRFE